MKIFEVYCYSSCGTYFAAYLKSVTVIADSEDEAKTKALAWCKRNGNGYLVDKKDKLGVRELVPDSFGVIDYDESSDY